MRFRAGWEIDPRDWRFGPFLIPFTALGAALGAPAAAATTTGLMAAGTGLAAAGTIGQARAAAAQAKAAQSVAEYNAALQEREAKAIEQETLFEQVRAAERGARTRSALQARMAAAGAVTTAGAPLLLAAEQESELALENLLIGYEGATAAQRARSQGAIDIMQGKIYGRRGRAAQTAGYVGAGGTLLTGFSKTFE